MSLDSGVKILRTSWLNAVTVAKKRTHTYCALATASYTSAFIYRSLGCYLNEKQKKWCTKCWENCTQKTKFFFWNWDPRYPVTLVGYILAMWQGQNISYQCDMLQIYPTSVTCFKYILPVWHASNISYQSDMLQIYPTTLIWLGYISTQYIHPNISGHNIQGQTFPIQCKNIYPSKGEKKDGRRTY